MNHGTLHPIYGRLHSPVFDLPGAKEAILKLLFIALFLTLCGAAIASEPTFQVITNQTPSVAVPESWAYGAAPGAYFWNGFRTAAAIVAFCWIFAAIRTAICDDKEEL